MASGRSASPMPAEPDRGPEDVTFTSPPARALGWFLYAVAVANFVDLALRGRDRSSLVAAVALVLGCGIVYVLCLRPSIQARHDELVLHNPLRDLRVPWASITEIDVTDVLRVHVEGRPYRAWTPQQSNRQRLRARMRTPPRGVPAAVADAVAGKSHAEYVAARLTELSRIRGAPTDARARHTWSVPAVLAIVVPALLLVAVVVIR